MTAQTSLCPCQSGHTYQLCCEPKHSGAAVAASPEALMRSRYAAFVLGLYPYLIQTHAIDHLNGLTEADLAAGPHPQWLGLDVLESGENGKHGSVTFKAWYKADGQLDAIFEKSAFELRDGLWQYTTGEQFTCKLPGRNDACICKSGKKFKQCCGK